ncbi:MAG: hypothetical protein GX231_01015 [Tissierellia bacterium]|nr:hypothetical protein [Tissierellia bacterium]
MRRLLLSILAFTMILVSCIFSTEEKVLKKLEKHLDKYTGYKTELIMQTIMDNKESQYKMKESCTLGGKYKLEIMEPSDSDDIVIEYDGEKIYLKHASMKESIELNPIKKFDQSLLIGKFLRERKNIDSIEVEKINGVEYYVFCNDIEGGNKYSKKQIIYLKKKDFKPHKLKILDEKSEERVIIEYSNFEFIN